MAIIDTLKQLTQALRAMENAPTEKGPARAFMDAMEQFWEDGLAGYGTSAPAVEKFLDAAAPRVEDIFPFLDQTIAMDVERFVGSAFQGTEWQRVCRIRSAMAAFDTAFLPRFEDTQEGMEDEDLDAEIREKGDSEGGLAPEAIPKGTPESHWWWFI